MYSREYTPERIKELKPNEIFVFGSNLAGSHGGGAARLAYNHFGAIWGQGVGLQGQSYGIPTMHGGVDAIKPYVDEFVEFAKQHIEYKFLVTRIGCGIAAFTPDEIAPLFKDAIEVENVILPEDFVEVLSKTENNKCSSIIKWDSEKDFLEKYRALMKRVKGGDSTAYYQVKELRAKEFRNTVEIVNQGHYVSESGKEYVFPDDSNMMYNTMFYECEIHMSNFPQCDEPTIVEVHNIDCLYAGVQLKEQGYNPAVLNMASRRNPGGGVTTGARAQEETLFRRTNLFCSLYQFAPYAEQYDIKPSHHQYPLDRNFGGVYTPNAIYFRESEQKGYALLEKPVCLSFITVAGMNRPDLTTGGMIANHHVEPIKNKIRTIFRIGLVHGHDSLVLGALGCGAFRNPPRHVARLFHEVMDEPEFKDKYRRIIFAILDDHNANHKHNPVGNFRPFAEEFDHTGNKESLSVDTVKVLSEKSLNCLENRQKSSISVNDNFSDGHILHQERFGKGLVWRLYSNGILEISGCGRMPDYINHWLSYTGEGQAPWVGCDRYGVMPNVLRICEGITYIGENAFESFGCLKEIVLPQSLQEIGKEAFFDCFHVERINLPHHMNIDYFDLAELPLYYNKDFVIVGDELVQRKV
jgi:uncharacterized protein (TIGR02452 family)